MDGEPRTATLTFTQLVGSVTSVIAQDGRLDFHTTPELCGDSKFIFKVALRPQSPKDY